MATRTEIRSSKLLLVEGADAYYFFISAYQAFGANGVQVMDFGGINQLTKFLKTLSLLPGYEKVNAIVVVRDAEGDPISAVDSVKHSLKQASLEVPIGSFQFAGNSPRVAFMILPGFGANDNAKQSLLSGTLEDLCLKILKDNSTLPCVDSYIQCLRDNGIEINRLHKARLHSYLSGRNEFVGLKIGEASKAGAWDWNHKRLQSFKDVITAM